MMMTPSAMMRPGARGIAWRTLKKGSENPIFSRLRIGFSSLSPQSDGIDDTGEEEIPKDLGPNPGLASVMSQGLPKLQKIAMKIQKHTQVQGRSVGDPTKLTLASEGRSQNIGQLSEASRIRQSAENVWHRVPVLLIQGEPLHIIKIEVNSNLTLATIHWALPAGLLLDLRLDNPGHAQEYHRIAQQVQEKRIIKGRGQKDIQKYIHNELRFYYPPKIRMMPAKGPMLVRAVQALQGMPTEFDKHDDEDNGDQNDKIGGKGEEKEEDKEEDKEEEEFLDWQRK